MKCSKEEIKNVYDRAKYFGVDGWIFGDKWSPEAIVASCRGVEFVETTNFLWAPASGHVKIAIDAMSDLISDLGYPNSDSYLLDQLKGKHGRIKRRIARLYNESIRIDS